MKKQCWCRPGNVTKYEGTITTTNVTFVKPLSTTEQACVTSAYCAAVIGTLHIQTDDVLCGILEEADGDCTILAHVALTIGADSPPADLAVVAVLKDLGDPDPSKSSVLIRSTLDAFATDNCVVDANNGTVLNTTVFAVCARESIMELQINLHYPQHHQPALFSTRWSWFHSSLSLVPLWSHSSPTLVFLSSPTLVPL